MFLPIFQYQTTTHLANKIFQRVPWDFRVLILERLCKIGLEDIHTHLKVRLVEVVRHVPPNLSILPSLLYDSVEESQDEDQCWEGFVLALRKSN